MIFYSINYKVIKKMSASLDKLFSREFDKKNGQVIQINQCEIGDVGCVVWDAAIVLSSYLDTDDFVTHDGKNVLEGKSVLELGSGTGIVGIQAATLGASTVITDLEEFIPLISLNIEGNRHLIKGNAKAETLVWGGDTCHPPPNYLLLADCIYYEESLEPLVKTIVNLCDKGTAVFCCYEERTTGNKPALEKKFFELIRQSFHVEEIPIERQDKVYSSPDIHIMKFRKR